MLNWTCPSLALGKQVLAFLDTIAKKLAPTFIEKLTPIYWGEMASPLSMGMGELTLMV